MPKFLYNEGRVVGYSAYEIFVQQSIANGVKPENITSEKDWLTSSIGMGSSLLLQINPDTDNADIDGIHFRDFPLPANSQLCAANSIIGSLFLGTETIVNGSSSANISHATSQPYVWNRYVADYGNLLFNNAIISPPEDGSYSPTSDKLGVQYQGVISEYSKIIDGIVIQPGTWSESRSSFPFKLLNPDLTSEPVKVPTVRLLFMRRVTQPFHILLTGFTLRSVVAGVTKGPVDSAAGEGPENGDMLGPAGFPWASKILFSVPSAFIRYFVDSTYTRCLDPSNSNGDKSDKTVTDYPIIDMLTTDPSTYYINHSEMREHLPELHVSDLALFKDASILTVYQKSAEFPPALYGTRVKLADEDTQLYPLDVVAPGTVKIFTDEGPTMPNVVNYETQFPENVGVARRQDSYEWWQLNAEGGQTPIAAVTLADDHTALVATGNNFIRALSLADAQGKLYSLAGNAPVPISTDILSWENLIAALTQDQKIDILGQILGELKNAKSDKPYRSSANAIISPADSILDIRDIVGAIQNKKGIDLLGTTLLLLKSRLSGYVDSSEDHNITIEGTANTKDEYGGMNYSGQLTLNHILMLLSGKGSIDVNFKTKGYDPNSFEYVEITEAFRQATMVSADGEGRPVEFVLQFGDQYTEYVPMRPWNGESTHLANYANRNDGENKSGGVYRVFLKLYHTTAGTTSRFELIVKGYLARDYSTGTLPVGTTKYRGTGFVWRGKTYSSHNAYPLFNADSDQINCGANLSAAITYQWKSVPEGNPLCKSTGTLYTADVSPWSWGANVVIQGNQMQGLDQIRLIDRSYGFDDTAPTRLTTIAGSNVTVEPSSAGSSTGVVKWDAGIIVPLPTDSAEHAEWEKTDKWTVSRSIRGIYAINS